MSLTLIILNFFPFIASIWMDSLLVFGILSFFGGTSHKVGHIYTHQNHSSLIPIQTLMMALILCGPPSLYFHLAAINLQTLGTGSTDLFSLLCLQFGGSGKFCFSEALHLTVSGPKKSSWWSATCVNKLGFCEWGQLLYSQSQILWVMIFQQNKQTNPVNPPNYRLSLF